MAHAEVSAIFNLKRGIEHPVSYACIGSGVSVEMLDHDWLVEVKEQCPKVEAREQVEWNRPYTHRLFYQLPAPEDTFDERITTAQEKQLILKAIVLSRLVKPTSIGYDNVWVKSFYRSDGKVRHYHDQFINNLNVAFPIQQLEDANTITDADANTMADLWDSLVYFLDNAERYKRIVRAIKTHELAYSIYFAETAHPIMHAALESLICTGHLHNKAQVTQRLPQLVSFVTHAQAEEIYKLCGSFKHAAEAMLLDSSSVNGKFTESDHRRVDAVILLRLALRDLLLRALKDRSFADLLADKVLLRQRYPVFDSKGKVVKH